MRLDGAHRHVEPRLGQRQPSARAGRRRGWHYDSVSLYGLGVSTPRARSPKRRKGPTPRNRSRAGLDGAASSSRAAPSERRRSSPPGSATAPPNSRYTAPNKNRGPFRPTWHKVTGALFIVLGLGIFVLNDAEWFGVHLMPGGHNELYAILGIAVAVSSTWWFGWFDRPPGRR